MKTSNVKIKRFVSYVESNGNGSYRFRGDSDTKVNTWLSENNFHIENITEHFDKQFHVTAVWYRTSTRS